MIWRRSDSDEFEEQPADPERHEEQGETGQFGSRIESIIEAAERAAAGIRQDAEARARQYLEESRARADEAASERVAEMANLTDNLIERARDMSRQSDELIAALEDAGRRLLHAAPGQVDAGDGVDAPRQADTGGEASTAATSAGPATPERDPGPEGPGFEGSPAAPLTPPAPVPSEPESPPPPPPDPPPPASGQWSEPGPPTAGAEPPISPAHELPQDSPGPAGREGEAKVSEGARLLATQMAVAGSSRDEIARRLQTEFGIFDPTAILNEIGV